MPKKCVIISGGEFSPIEGLNPEDFVIACDRGYEYAVRCGVTPDLIVGDFDSYAGPLPEGIPVDRHRARKDDTDTMLAIRHALEIGFQEIELLCALGGRLDHSLANIQSAVFAHERGLMARIKADGIEMFIHPGGTLRLERREGWFLSLFSLGDVCTGVCIRGAKYPLDKATLTKGFPLGVSNEWVAAEAEISLDSGTLLVVMARE